MIRWRAWSGAAFGAATSEAKPVLLCLARRGEAAAREKAFAEAEGLGEKAVLIAVDEADRPDIFIRYAEHGDVLLLSGSGEVVDGAALRSVSEKLPAWLNSTSFEKSPTNEGIREPVWTGAVGPSKRGGLNADLPRQTVAAAVAAAELSLAEIELLLYAAVEWSDASAKTRVETELDRLCGALRRGEMNLRDGSWTIALLWNGFAAFGRETWRAHASDATAALVRERFDAERRSFRHGSGAGSPVYADENALAALALQRAAAFEPASAYGRIADEVLAFLRGTLYDPLLGMVHRRREDGTLVFGLVGDAAWTIAAFAEAFQLSGHKPHREFADELARFLFQELWDRDGGGFLDRVPQRDDLGLLRRPRLAAAAEQGAALEGLWRLHHLKGNMNYRRWLEWALARVGGEGAPAPAARVQDMLARGRLDLELIGRPGEPACDALLAAIHRQHAPRRIVSFVDPDDQDYILAHKLEAPDYPRLFGCGPDLKAVASAATPDAVAGVIKALRA